MHAPTSTLSWPARGNLEFPEPQDYFRGVGHDSPPTAKNILMFVRTTRQKLQQEALQNRSHHRFVLAVNLQTRGHVNADNRVLTFAPGESLLILPYQFHHFTQLESETLRWVFCTFEVDRPGFLEPLRNRVLATGTESRQAHSDLWEAWRQGTQNRWGEGLQEAKVQARLTYLLLSLMQDLRASAPDLPPEPRESLLRTVNRLMSEWHGRTVVVADLARELDLSESRLRSQFKSATGLPLGSYLQNYRLNRAMSLLRTTTLPIAEIAEEAGFGSPQAFSRLFRKKTGGAPRVYRKQGHK
jgi:AraC-like DNA-binding protein